MRINTIPSLLRKHIPIIPPDLALCLTLIRPNYPCHEHLFMVQKVLKPLKLYCIKLSGLGLFSFEIQGIYRY